MPVFFSSSCNTMAEMTRITVTKDGIPLPLHLHYVEVRTSYGEVGRITCMPHVKTGTQIVSFHGHDSLAREAREADRAYVMKTFLPYAKVMKDNAQRRVEEAQADLRQAEQHLENILRQTLLDK